MDVISEENDKTLEEIRKLYSYKRFICKEANLFEEEDDNSQE